MEIAKLYETAAEKLDKAIEVCEKSKINLTSLTVIAAASGNIYSAPNWKRLNDAFEEEETHSEDEALAKMLLAGENAVEHIVTLDAKTKLPVDPYQKCLEILVKINTENAKCNILQGKNSKVVLTSVNSDIAKFAEQIIAEEEKKKPKQPEKPAENAAETSDQNADPNAAPSQPPLAPAPGEPEGSAAHAGIDASGLQMIFDDWESTAEKPDGNESKPFNGQSLSNQADKAEVINQVQNMANNAYPNGQMQNGMYQQQGMNGMYGGQMQGGMYQQQSVNGPQMQNGMYGGQNINGMYGGQMQGGMYQQQGMNGMYGGQMQGGMYGGQMQGGMYGGPMNGMYGGQIYGQQSVNGPMYGQQQGGYGQQPNGGRQSLYLNPAQGGAGQQSVYTMPGSATSSYRSKLQAPVHSSVVNTQSVSVYGTNIGEGDNNAIFKDRLADILNSSSAGKSDDTDKTEVMMSAKEKKNATKKDAKHH
ncbi:MAG: hypothetical protein IJL67_12415 [Oscillospiraceae bacterium]|nr:hypothetical protein [Oscillospiraceae bacterium]